MHSMRLHNVQRAHRGLIKQDVRNQLVRIAETCSKLEPEVRKSLVLDDNVTMLVKQALISNDPSLETIMGQYQLTQMFNRDSISNHSIDNYAQFVQQVHDEIAAMDQNERVEFLKELGTSLLKNSGQPANRSEVHLARLCAIRDLIKLNVGDAKDLSKEILKNLVRRIFRRLLCRFNFLRLIKALDFCCLWLMMLVPRLMRLVKLRTSNFDKQCLMQ